MPSRLNLYFLARGGRRGSADFARDAPQNGGNDMDMQDQESRPATRTFTAAEIGALAHLYRGEVYRSTLWRTRLDTTTNWAVVTLGVALSITYSSPESSALPLVLVGVLIFFFVILEARRYRYFNVWRARARWMERHVYAPMLQDGDLHLERGWQQTLARDYWTPAYHIDFLTALGRRIRRNYLWILIIQTVAYLGKLAIHPTTVTSFDALWKRAAVGPIPGQVMLLAGSLYIATWVGLAVATRVLDRSRHRGRSKASAMG
jgi:uncharacterized membrane protein